MTDTPPQRHNTLPQAELKPVRRLSWIWLVPLLSLLITGWLVYQHYLEADISIQIEFDSGEGLVPGRTEVRFQGIEIGKVKQISLQPQTEKVLARIDIHSRFEFLLRESTQFWLVKPQVSSSGVSGLDTLLTGSYLTLRSGDGLFNDQFVALKEAPPLAEDAPGLHVQLVTDTLGSIHEGTPVHYRKMQVGEVLRYQFSPQQDQVIIDIHIQPEFSALVRQQSRFWNSSGVSVSGSLAGIKVQTESLTALLVGGISFYNPEHIEDEGPSKNGDQFQLFADFNSVDAGLPIRIEFKTAQGLVEGDTKILYKGLTAGVLKKIYLKDSLDAVDAEFMMDPRTEAVLNSGAQFWLVKPQVSLSGVSGLETLLSGSHIEMKIGQGTEQRQFVALDEAPLSDDDEHGLILELTANDLGSIQPGSPLLYRKLVVGEVKSYRLSTDGEQVEVKVFIKPEYAHLVKTTTRFWNSSGIRVSGGLSGIKVQTESLAALIRGGISFMTPEHLEQAATAQPHDRFRLYDDFSQAQVGIKVEIEFDSAQGLEEGKTIVKYKGFTVAQLQHLSFKQNLNKVVAEFLFDPRIEAGIKRGAQFWLVQPQISLDGIQGLDAVLSGAYVQMAPGNGKAKRRFIALQEPPPLDRSAPGLYLTLEASQLHSVSAGDGIWYKGIQVGQVRDVSLRKADDKVAIGIFIEDKYAHLVQDNSRFWNLSGFRVDVDFPKIAVQSSSLRSLIQGGIAFETPSPMQRHNKLTRQQFTLFSDQAMAQRDGIEIQIRLPQGYGLKEGAEVRYQGMTVGSVLRATFSEDIEFVQLSVLMQTQMAPLLNESTVFWLVQPQFGLAKIENLETLVSGHYLQMRAGRGQPKRLFTALAQPPKRALPQQGLSVILQTPHLGSLKAGLPVYYRDVAVGEITGYELADEADQVYVYLLIQPRYAPLVREHSQFWNVSGIAMNAGLLSGVEIKMDTLESWLAGGVAFATPNNDEMGDVIETNTRFELHAEADEDWLKWSPKIQLQGSYE